MVLGCMDLDYALIEFEPTKPNSESTIEQKALYEKWERSNRMSLMIMKGLKGMDMTIYEGFPVHFIMTSLPS